MSTETAKEELRPFDWAEAEAKPWLIRYADGRKPSWAGMCNGFLCHYWKPGGTPDPIGDTSKYALAYE